MILGRHMTKGQSDWSVIWDSESQGIAPNIPDHPFCSNFVSGSGRMGTRLVIVAAGELLRTSGP